MNITEKAAYLKGLCEGLKIDETNAEGKLLKAIVEIIDDMALSVADLEDNSAMLEQYIEEVDEDLGRVEREVCDCCGEEDDEDLSIICPNCKEEFFLDEGDIELDEIECPCCGEKIDMTQFDDCDFTDEADDCEGECGCGCH